MKLLADTNILLWAALRSGKLSAAASAFLIDEANQLFFSAASIWEVALKTALGRAEFQVDAEVLLQDLVGNGYVEIPVSAAHGIAAAALPLIHKDPFDRILIAHAAAESMTLLTSDATIAKYAGPVRLV